MLHISLFGFLIFGFACGDRLDNLKPSSTTFGSLPNKQSAIGGHQTPVDAYRAISTIQEYNKSYQKAQNVGQYHRPQNFQQNANQHLSETRRDFIPIVKELNNPNNGDGSYSFSYEGGNGISASEFGVFNPGQTSEDGLQAKSGSYSYTGPDNVVYSISYTAGAEGFVPVGAHIPTPPPIPEAIQKSLAGSEEFNRYTSNEISDPNKYTTVAFVKNQPNYSNLGKILTPPSQNNNQDYNNEQDFNDNYTK